MSNEQELYQRVVGKPRDEDIKLFTVITKKLLGMHLSEDELDLLIRAYVLAHKHEYPNIPSIHTPKHITQATKPQKTTKKACLFRLRYMNRKMWAVVFGGVVVGDLFFKSEV